jgi:hypothetical protein
MPALEGNNLIGYPDGPARAAISSSDYLQYLNQNVFQPVAVPGSECKPPAGTNYILSYPSLKDEDVPGWNWDDWSLKCGSGGWVISGDEIFRVMNDLANGNVLLTNAEKQQMFDDCLGWDCAVGAPCPAPYVCKNGHLKQTIDGNVYNVWTYAGIVKSNVPVVVVVNSALPDKYQNAGWNIIALVRDALANAVVLPPVPFR